MFSFGYILLNPLPNTAIVLPILPNAPRCAAVSIPRARPLIMHIFCSDNFSANLFAWSHPYWLQFLEPTIARDSLFNNSLFPLTYIVSGGDFIFNSLLGYVISL